MNWSFLGKAAWILSGVLLLVMGAFAEEKLEINGTFAGTDFPEGWVANKPNSWDETGTVKIIKVPDIEKSALQLQSQKKKMHLCTRQDFPVEKGNVVVLKAIVKGQGNVFLGLYAYPAGSQLGKEIKTSEEWTEVVTEIEIYTDKIKNVRIVAGVVPGASVEIMELTASVKTREEKK